MNPMKLLAFAMLLVGISLAAAFGSRNGPDHVAYRLAQAELPGVIAEMEALPPPKTRGEEVCEGGWGMFDEDEEGVETQRPEVYETLEACSANAPVHAPDQGPKPVATTCKCPVPLTRRTVAEDDHAEERVRLAQRKSELAAVALPKPMDRLTQWFAVGGIGWGAGVVLIVAGALLARRQQQDEMSGDADTGGEAVDFLETVREINARLKALGELLEPLPMDTDSPEARALIDGCFNELIEPVVDARGRYVARHGLAVFADYFGVFAGGERNLARTWSAITDGHSEEARRAHAKAVDAFAQAEESWLKAEG